MKCKNCNQVARGKFCAHCGQKTSVGDITFAEIIHEGWHTLTHTDRSYFRFIREMTLRPGQTISNYLSGKRKSYFSPITFYLVTTSLLMLATHWLFSMEDELFRTDNEFGNYLGRNFNYVLLLAMPLAAFFLFLLFRNSVKGYAASLVAVVFAFGIMNFYLLVMAILFLVPFLFFINLHYGGQYYVELAGYFLLAYVFFSFLKPGSLWQFFKFLLLILLIFFFVDYVGKGILLLNYGMEWKQLMQLI